MLKFMSMACACAVMLAPGSLAHEGFGHEPDAHLEQAREVVILAGVEQLFTSSIRQTIPMIRPSLGQAWPAASPEAADRAMALIESAMLGLAPELVDETAVVYKRLFTQSDLAELADFMRSPVGQRFIESQSRLMEEGQMIGERLGERAMADVMPQVTAIMEES
ncbi:DUF2059 domain-containing protein [Alkalicaulis satelles]|nr:DUF2059 domain-containing protein [Alkalicaulis satelles]